MDNEKKKKKQSGTGKKKPKAQKPKAQKPKARKPKAAKNGKGNEIDHGRLLPAMNSIMRRHIMRTLHATEGPLSPCRLSGMLGEPVSSVSYHVSTLRNYDAIELVAEKQVRGAVAHYYVSRVGDDEVIGKLLEVTRERDEAELPIPD